jgi:hypothetical protein
MPSLTIECHKQLQRKLALTHAYFAQLPAKTLLRLYLCVYGLPQLQIEFDIPMAVSSDDRKGTNNGLGDLLYGIKWRFFDDEKTQTQIGIYPQMFAPTGNYREGLGGGRPNYILPLLAEKSWGKWTLYGNVGYRLQIALDEQSYWYTGAVLQREINDRLSLGVELFGNTTTVPNAGPTSPSTSAAASN